MPRFIREFDGNFQQFKSMVDMYLMEVPDCPILDGYSSHNLDGDNRQSNSLIDWNSNLNNENWLPGALSEGSSSIL